MEKSLPAIPAKRYFTIGEVSELCLVKPYVLRYWEQEFTQLKPMKRRGNRRYYQRHEVQLIRRIRELLYEEGFTISGARNRLTDAALIREAEEEAKDKAAGLRLAQAEAEAETGVDPGSDSSSAPQAGLNSASGFAHETAVASASADGAGKPRVLDTLLTAAAKAQRSSGAHYVAANVAGRRANTSVLAPPSGAALQADQMRAELLSIRDLLSG